MASPTMSYLICTMALIVLILVMPSFFEIQRNSIADEMTRRELTEIADYTSNTLANLFFLAESSQSSDISLSKELVYLPLKVEGSFYGLRIDDEADSPKVFAYLLERQSISGQSWVVPSIGVDSGTLEIKSYELDNEIAVASCHGGPGNFYVSLEYGEK